MFIKIEFSSGIPIYRQIMERIKYSIANGSLKPNDQLPSVRQLSMDLKVNPNTISKAYSELEHEQVIYTRRGMGTFVSEKRVEITQDVKVEIVSRLAERLAVEAVQVGVDEAELRLIISKILNRFYQGGEKGERV